MSRRSERSERSEPVEEVPGDDRPSEAVLDELLAMFQADDPASGADIDLNSPEVEQLLSGSQPRPRPKNESHEAGSQDRDASAGEDVDDAGGTAEGSASDEAESSEPQASETSIASGGAAITIIEDDLLDLPDVGYLDEEPLAEEPDQVAATARSGEPERVFIDDDSKELGEIVGSAEAARATGIEPKLRERRAAVQKAAGRKRLRWVVLIVVVLVLIVAGLAVLGSAMFSVDDVEVSNAVYSRDELAPIVEDMHGEPTLRLDTGAFEERIERIPWVEEARVRTQFPDSVTIEVRERAPAATFRGDDGQFRVIDADGRVLDVVEGQPTDFVLVRSDEPPDIAPGEFAPDGFRAAASMAGALTPSVRPITESIDVDNEGTDIRLQLSGGTEVLLGPGEDLLDKLVRLETVMDMNSEGPPSRIDVSTDDVTVQGSA